MPLLLKNRVLETCTSPGTGSVTLLGASTGYQSFNTAYSATSSTVYYTIADQGGPNWEVGVGTFTPTATLSRDTVLSSSAGGTTKVNFSSGTQNVWVDYPSEKAVVVDELDNILVNQSTDQGTGVLQVTGQSTFNGAVTDKSLNLQGGNNNLAYSQDFSNATWIKGGWNVSGTLYTAPDGTTTANRLTGDGSTAYNYLYNNVQVLFTAGTTFTVSYNCLYGTNRYVQLNGGAAANNFGAVFDLTLGTVTSTGATGTGVYTSSSINLTNQGFYRITVTGNLGATANNGYAILYQKDVSTYQTGTPAVAANTRYTTIWGAQLELGTVASAYTPTTTAAITTTNNISVPSGQIITQAGTASSPAILIGSTNTGFYGTTAYSQWAYSGTPYFQFSNANFALNSTTGLTWGSGNATSATTLALYQDSANTLAQRNSTNAQTFRLYNTYTDASNYERLSIDWTTTANTATISTQNAGTGSARTLAIGQDLYVNGVRVGRGGGNIASNTVVGNGALPTSATGGENIVVGIGALTSLSTGNYNCALGAYSLAFNNTGSSNIAIGDGAIYANTTGSNSIGIGFQTLFRNTIASGLTAIGTLALPNNTTNVATLGTITGGTGYTNGTYTGVVMTLSSGSSAITYPTATIVVSGGAVTSVTLTSNGVGFKDTTTVLTAPAASIGGTGSGFTVPVATLQSGTGNVAVGYQAGYSNSTGQQNTFTGYQAGYSNTTGTYNTAIGYSALYSNTTGQLNSALSRQALNANTSGSSNTASGLNSLLSNTTGSYGTAHGGGALSGNTTGNNNTAIGYQAGFGNISPNANTTGSNNTYIGYNTVGSANNNTNEMVIGYQAVGLGSNTTVIGNTSTTLTQTYGVTKSTNYTVATLPSASTSGVGARAFVTDALTPVFGATVVTGGAVATPVYSDSVNWKVG